MIDLIGAISTCMTPALYHLKTSAGITGPYFDVEIYELWSRREITVDTDIALVTPSGPDAPTTSVFIPFGLSSLYKRLLFVEAKAKSPEMYRMEEQGQLERHSIELRKQICFYLKWLCVLATITFVLLVLFPFLMSL